MLKHKHLSNHNTWDTFKTHMEEGFSLLTIMKDQVDVSNPYQDPSSGHIRMWRDWGPKLNTGTE